MSDEFYEKDGDLYKKSSGWGSDEKIGKIERGLGGDYVNGGIFNKSYDIERGVFDGKIEISRSTLLNPHDEGATIQTGELFRDHGQTSRTWTRDSDGHKVYDDQVISSGNDGSSSSPSSSSSHGSYSGGGSYSGSDDNSLRKGVLTVVFVIVCIFLGIGLISSITKSANNQNQATQRYSPAPAPAPVSSEDYSGFPSAGRYTQNTPSVIREYFQNKFQFSVKSTDVVNDRITVNFEINTLTNGEYFFLCSKQNISDSVNSTEKTYIVDSKGAKHEMIGGPMGNILQNTFPDNEGGYNPDRTYRFKLRPHESVMGRMEFPMISEGTRKFALVIPGVNGWQSEIKIDNIQLIQGESFPADEQGAASRQTWETYKTGVGQIRLGRAFICRSMTYGSPSSAVTSVSEESLREWTGRGQLIYYLEYENAIPNDTRVHVQWFREGTPIGKPCDELLQRSSGASSCRLEYQFTVANYEAQLSVDGSEVDRQSFAVLK